MPVWCYEVAPELQFIVRTAKTEPKLLSRTFGPVVEAGGETADASLVLDLAARDSGGARERSDHEGEGTTARTVSAVYKGVPWSCAISRAEEKTWTIAFRSRVMREYLAMHIALLPALRYLLTNLNSALILGAAYELDGNATVLSGPTGTGKTSLLLAALARGARFVGDEYIGMTSAGQASPIVRSLALRRSTLALAPGAADTLSASRRLALRVAEFTTSITRGRLEPLSHLRPEDLGMEMADWPVPVRHLVWLEQTDGSTAAAVGPMRKEDVVQELSLRQTVHQRAYGDITPFLDPVSGRDDSESVWRGVLTDGLANVECHRLQFPAGGLADAFECLEQLGQQ